MTEDIDNIEQLKQQLQHYKDYHDNIKQKQK